MDHARSRDNIKLAYELVAAGQAEALATLLAALTPRELRELERGDYVERARRDRKQGTGFPPLVRDLNPSIWVAVLEAGHTQLVPVVLSAGFSPNARIASGETVLTVASEEGAVDAVRDLLSAGADPNARSRFGASPLHQAASPTIVDLLVDTGANVDATDDDGDAPVVPLAYSSDPRTVLQLVRRGANPHARGLQGQTLLYNLQDMWMDELDVDILRGLVEAGYDPVAEQQRFGDEYPDTNDEVDAFLRSIGLTVNETVREFSEEFRQYLLERLERAISEQRYGDVDLLLNRFIKEGDVLNDPWGKDALDTVALARYYPGMEALIDAGVRPARTDGMRPPTAPMLVREQCYDLLFERKPFALNFNLHDRGETGLQIAAQVDSDDFLVNAILEAGADPNARGSDGRTPLHVTPYSDTALRLLNAGADMDAQDDKGCTPLFYAGGLSDYVFATLLENGADPNVRSFVAEAPPTALHAALGIAPAPRPWERHSNPVAALEALIQHGFDIRFHQERYGDTFLLPRIDSPAGSVNATARILIANGANPTHRDAGGRTPLHHAVAPLVINDPYVEQGKFMFQWEAPIEALAEAGADLEARDDAGDTPLLAAVKVRHREKRISPLMVFGYATRHFAKSKATKEGKTPPTIPAPDETANEVVFRAGVAPPYETVARLVARGADVHAVDRAGRKALHYAAAWGSTNAVKALLEAGANPSEEDPRGITPLLAAVNPPRLAEGIKARIAEGVIDLLVAAGADPHARSSIGITAYEYATMVNHEDRGYQELAKAWDPV